MRKTSFALLGAALVLPTGTIVADALPKHVRRHASHVHAAPRGEAAANLVRDPYNDSSGWDMPGAIISSATRRSQREPGVTLELAPDARETATGGPVGGVPGYDGS